MSTFTPVLGDLRPASQSLIKHLKADESRVSQRYVDREHWMLAGVALGVILTPAAALLMLAAPLSLGAVAIGASALPTIGVAAMGGVLLNVASTIASGISAGKNKKVADYLDNQIRHMEKGGLPHTFLTEQNATAGFFQRLSNRRAEKAAQRINPLLKEAIKHGL